jgi:hypothetical protein
VGVTVRTPTGRRRRGSIILPGDDSVIHIPKLLRGLDDQEMVEAIRRGLARIESGIDSRLEFRRTLVPQVGGGMPFAGVGVSDAAAGAGIAEVHTRQRTVNSITNATEQIVVALPNFRQVLGNYAAHSGTITVLAAAHGATAGFAVLINRSTAQMAAIRRVEFIEYPSAATIFASAPRITMERMTHTGTPSAGLISPAKTVRTTQNGEVAAATNVAEFRVATTGLTLTAGEAIYAFLVRPVIVAYAASGASEPPAVPEYWTPLEGEGIVLANAEGVVFRQADAGTASDTRKFHIDLAWEEYTVP